MTRSDFPSSFLKAFKSLANKGFKGALLSLGIIFLSLIGGIVFAQSSAALNGAWLSASSSTYNLGATTVVPISFSYQGGPETLKSFQITFTCSSSSCAGQSAVTLNQNYTDVNYASAEAAKLPKLAGAYSVSFSSPVLVSGRQANYSWTYQGATITYKPVITITATAASKAYDGTTSSTSVPTITNGTLLPGDTLYASQTYGSAVVGSMSLYPTATIRNGSMSNVTSSYSITYANAVGTITTAPITVTPTSGLTKVYGASDPTLSYTITSGALVGTDTLTGALTRATGNYVGNYAIAQGTLAAPSARYTLNVATGVTMAITQRPITITAVTSSKSADGTTTSSGVPTLTSGTLATGDSKVLTQSFDSASFGTRTLTPVAVIKNAQQVDVTSNYNVTAVTASGTISQIQLLVTPNAQTKIYGNSDPSITYSVTSGGSPYSISLTGSLSRASGEAVGTYEITQGTLAPPSSNYALTVAPGITMSIAARQIAITTTACTKVYDGTDTCSQVPTLTYGTLVTGHSATYSERFSSVHPGSIALIPTVVIRDSQGNDQTSNYSINPISGLGTISQKSVTITPTSGQSKVSGTSDPTFTYATNGLLVSDSLTGALGRNQSGTTAGENAGTYAITQGTLANSDYAITMSTPTVLFTITTVNITATPNSAQSKVYGDSDPTLTYSITSGALQGSDTLTGTLNRAAGTNVGSYAIYKGTLAPPPTGYTMTFGTGITFAITQRPITITATSSSKSADGTITSSDLPTLTSGTLASGDSIVLSQTYSSSLAGSRVLTPAAVIKNALQVDVTSNYNITKITASGTISQTQLTVSPTLGLTKIYGNSDPTLTYSFTSGAMINSETLNGSISRASGETVGTYSIGIGTLAVPNNKYVLTFTSDVTFSITQRPITITAVTQSKNGDGTTSSTGVPTLTSGTLATGDTIVMTQSFDSAGSGTRTLTPVAVIKNAQGFVVTSSYNVTAITAAGTISQIQLTVTPTSGQSKIYGNSDPSITYSITSGALLNSDALVGSLTRNSGESAGTYAISIGTLAVPNANYSLILAPGVTFAITKRDIAIKAAVCTKEYDGTDACSQVSTLFSGTLGSGDIATFSEHFNTVHAGTVSLTPTVVIKDSQGVDQTGSYAINLLYIAGTISKKPLTITPTNGQSKSYGTSDPTFTYTTSGLIGGDSLTGAITRVSGETPGTYGLLRGSLVNTDYAFSMASPSVVFTINSPPTITVTPNSGLTKVYGNSDPTLSYQITSGTFPGTVSLTGSLARASGDTPGTYAISQGTLAISDPNYTLIVATGVTMSITSPPAITVTPTSGKTKVYGNSDPTLTYSITSGTLPGTVSLTGSLSRATGINVGTYAISQGTLAISDPNYTLNFAIGVTMAITPRPITIKAVTQSKSYDGTTSSTGVPTITSGTLAPDDTDVLLTQAFDSANSGTRTLTPVAEIKAPLLVVVTSNYNITAVTAPGTISQTSLRVTPMSGQSKIYGNNDPTLTYSVTSGGAPYSISLTGSLSRASGEAVGTYEITQGTLAPPSSNYALTVAPGITMSIAARQIAITTTACTKVYDGTDTCSQVPTLTYGTLVTGHSATYSERFSSVHPGSIALIPTVVIRDSQGNDQTSNYSINPISGLGTISQKSVTITPTSGQSKVSGTSDPTFTYATNGLLVSDSLTGALGRNQSGTTAGENAGTYAITQGTLANSDYAITMSTPTVLFTITTVNITATPNSAQSKVYGDSDPTLTYSITSGALQGSDTLTGTLNRAAGTNVGSYAIYKGTLAPPPTGYTMTFGTGITFAITQRPITITATSSSKSADGTITSSDLPTLTSGTLASGDSIVLSQTYSSSLAGSRVLTPAAVIKNALQVDVTSNYNITKITASGTISQTQLTVSPTLGLTKIYGNSDPTLTYSFTSGAMINSETLNGSISRASGETVGTYSIGIGTLAVPNNKYVLTFTSDVTFSITQRPITITAVTQSKNGDGTTSSTGVPTLTSGTLATGDTIVMTQSFDSAGSGTRTLTPVAVIKNAQGFVVTSSYNVTAITAAGTISQIQLTVTPTSGQSKIYGNSDPSITYSITSGALLNSDALVGSLTRNSGESAGTYAISIGTLAVPNANYSLILAPGVTFAITKRDIAIKAAVCTKEYDGTDACSQVSTLFSGTLGSGDIATFSEHFNTVHAGTVSLTPTVVIKDSQGVDQTGSYAINLLYIAGTISKKPLTITPTNGQSKSYGTSDPTFTYTTSGLIGGDSLTGAITRVSGETPGTYGLLRGSLVNTDYAFSMASPSVVFTINSPPTITVTPNSGLTKVYGNSDPTLSYQITSGTFPGTVSLTGSLARASGDTPGTYAISQGTLAISDPNYTLIVATGVTMSITSPPAITVTPTSGKTKVYGNSDPTLTYSITSGTLPGTVSLTGSLSRATGINVGTYAISQGTLAISDPNYTLNFATGVTMAITPRPITVTATSNSKTYDNSTASTSTPTISGGTLVSGQISTRTQSFDSIHVGSRTLTPSIIILDASNIDVTSNYAITPVSAAGTITTKALTITPVSGQSKAYRASDPSFTYTTSGLLGDDSLSGSLSRTSGESAGTYVFTKGTLANSDYSISLVTPAVSFTINSGAITVTPTSGLTKVFGDSDPTLSYSITSGALLGSDALTGSLSRDSGSAVGSYAITQGTLSAPSAGYTLNVVTGSTFTIAPRPITITAVTDSKPYNGSIISVFVPSITSGSLATGNTIVMNQHFESANRGENISIIPTAVIKNQNNVDVTANYEITAVNASGSISQIALVITPTSGKTKVYGNSEPALTYTITSGYLRGSDTLTGSLERASGDVSGTYAIGKGTLAASNDKYSITVATGVTMAITPRSITIKAVTDSKANDGTTTSTPSTSSPFLTTGSLASGDNIVITQHFNSASVGARILIPSAVITDSSGNDVTTSYSIVPVNAIGTITARAVVITPISGQSKVYGESDPTLTYTITSGSLPDSVTLTGSLSREPGSAVGTYSIGKGSLATSDSNYSFTLAPGVNFSVTQRPITLTAVTDSKAFDHTDDSTLTPLISGELATGQTATPTQAFDSIHAGSRTLNPMVDIKDANGTDVTSNYEIIPVTASGTISKAPLTITADSASIAPGGTYKLGTGSTNFKSSGDLYEETIGSVTLTSNKTGFAAGTQILTPSDATGGTFTASDYQITYKTGTLTVEKRVVLTGMGPPTDKLGVIGNVYIDAKSKVLYGPKTAQGWFSGTKNESKTYGSTPTPTTKPGSTPTPTPTTKPGSTPTPTPTTKPGSTPTPTPTTKPGSTPTPTPTPTR